MALILKKIYSFIKDLFVIIDNPKSGLFMVEYASWFYGLLTSVIIFILGHQLVNPYYMIEVRFMLVGGTALLMWLYWIYPCKLTTFFRVAMQFFMLIFWYSETYEFNRVFPNLDYFLLIWSRHCLGASQQWNSAVCSKGSSGVRSSIWVIGHISP